VIDESSVSRRRIRETLDEGAVRTASATLVLLPLVAAGGVGAAMSLVAELFQPSPTVAGLLLLAGPLLLGSYHLVLLMRR
jgi:hypothetical protein